MIKSRTKNIFKKFYLDEINILILLKNEKILQKEGKKSKK